MLLQVIEPVSVMYSSVVANYKWKECDMNHAAFYEKRCQTSSWGQVGMFQYTSTHTYVCECVWRWLVRLSVFACLVSAEWGRVICNCKCQVWLPEPLCEPSNTHRSHWTRPGQQNSIRLVSWFTVRLRLLLSQVISLVFIKVHSCSLNLSCWVSHYLHNESSLAWGGKRGSF